jgi:hypothetical protein
MSKPITLNKIPVANLIQVLTHLYEEGADFIDIHGEPVEGKENDILKVTVRPEYYNTEEEQSETDPEYLVTEVKPPADDINPISEDDIDDLI